MARTLFSGGVVVDGTGSPPAQGDVVVEDGRIIDVGTGLDGDVGVDCAGRTVLPGLFDCHVHVTINGVDFMAMMQASFSSQFYDAARNLGLLLDLGITSVRDACGADLGIKQAVERGLVVGPRMQISITMISQTGGHGDTWFPCGFAVPIMAPHPGRPGGVVDGVEEMRRKARELLRAGADVLKVATSGGVMTVGDDPRHGHFRDDELDVLVTEAASAGRYVMAHAHGSAGIKAAVRNGVRSIEHGFYLDDEAIEMMVERGTWLVPTLLLPQAILDRVAAGAVVAEESLRQIRDAIDAHRSGFARAVDAGVRVAMGTDSPLTPHGTNLDEIEMMARWSSMSPIEAWTAATSSAAALLGLEQELGSLAPGKRADLVVLAGEPHDLTNLAERVEQVWKDGCRVR